MNRRDTFKALAGGLLGMMGMKAAKATPATGAIVLTGKVGDEDWKQEWRHGEPSRIWVRVSGTRWEV